MEPVIIVDNVTVAYDGDPVLERVSVDIPKGALMAIVGPNGAGKSTLLKAILHLLEPRQGQITYHIHGARTFKEAQPYIAYIPQNNSVNWDFPATVFDIVMMGRYGKLGWFRRPKQRDKDMVAQCIHQVGLDEFQERQINELSGGQQQRVFLARALAQEAEVYILDEPFKGIDIKTEEMIVGMLKDMQKQGKTILVVHHALHTVKAYFNEVICLNRYMIGVGKVQDIFHDELVRRTFLPWSEVNE